MTITAITQIPGHEPVLMEGSPADTSPCPEYLQQAASAMTLIQHFRGAAEGEGLGNAFLSNIAAVDGIFHVCRAFEDPDVVHVEDRVDPVADLEIIHGCALVPDSPADVLLQMPCLRPLHTAADCGLFHTLREQAGGARCCYWQIESPP